MLSPADEVLALRDPAMPDLSVLLDDDALGAWLSERLDERVRVQARYLRYKPANSCVLVADVDSGSARWPCLFSGYAQTNADKITKLLARSPAGSVLAYEPGRGLLATTPAADRDLPGLARLDDTDARERLLRRLLGPRPGLSGASVQSLRHNPHRRWVGLVRLTAGPPVVVRCYRRENLHAASEAIGAWHDTGLRTPRLLGTHPRRGVAAVEYVDGEALPRTPGDEDSDFHAAGAMLARLHAQRNVVLRTLSPTEEARAASSAARQLVELLPEHRVDVSELGQVLSAWLAAMAPAMQPTHGDFSSDQVVIGSDGKPALIDLDAARLGDPAADLACADAAVERDVVVGLIDPATAQRRLGSLRTGYAELLPLPDEARLAAHEAAHLLRRAAEPFRMRLTPDWPSASMALVRRARRALHDHDMVGGDVQ